MLAVAMGPFNVKIPPEITIVLLSVQLCIHDWKYDSSSEVYVYLYIWLHRTPTCMVWPWWARPLWPENMTLRPNMVDRVQCMACPCQRRAGRGWQAGGRQQRVLRQFRTWLCSSLLATAPSGWRFSTLSSSGRSPNTTRARTRNQETWQGH